MPLKVIGAGMGRTGTTSLKAALEMLGFAPCCHFYNFLEAEVQSLVPVWGELIDGTSKDWERVYSNFKAAVDCPAWFYYRELAAFYPESKVILTVRDADKWFESTQETVLSDSVLDWINKTASPAMRKITDRATLGAAGTKVHDRDYMIGWFERHNAEVKRTIPKERLLVYEVKQGWEPLCKFLGVPVPAAPFPRLNDRHTMFSNRTA
jgi:hypothetical protein